MWNGVAGVDGVTWTISKRFRNYWSGSNAVEPIYIYIYIRVCVCVCVLDANAARTPISVGVGLSTARMFFMRCLSFSVSAGHNLFVENYTERIERFVGMPWYAVDQVLAEFYIVDAVRFVDRTTVSLLARGTSSWFVLFLIFLKIVSNVF